MSGLRYIDVCSGISAPTMAWKPLGWEALCFAEIEPAPRAVLAHHYPEVPLRGDFTEIEGTEYGPVDLLVGGTPCQSFSVAGLRGGLADDRGNLALQFARLASRARPRWVVWENVPGVLSIDGGRAFGSILGALAELGYGLSYRVLDAQHFGVPQRRRRVFVVGYLGDWRRAAAVLLERSSLSGNPPPRREAGQSAPTIPSRSTGGGGLGTDFDCDGGLIQAFGGNNTAGPIDIATACNSHGGPHGRLDFESETFVTHCFDARQSDVIQYGDKSGPLDTDAYSQALFSITPSNSNKDFNARRADKAQALTAGGNRPSARGGDLVTGFQTSQSGVREVSTHATLDANNGSRRHNGVVTASAVRRLTPRECERLQGFPDDFTLVPHRGKPMADGPRYKMLGNSMAVPVLRWIGERIEAVEHHLASRASEAA